MSGTFDKLLFTVISCAVPDPTNDHVRAKFSILNKSSLPIVYQLINEDGTNPRFLLHHFGEVGVKC